MTKALVLIPTFNHGRRLEYSLASVLAQTMGNLEVAVVGDGVPAREREIVRELVARDERVRFYDFPKSPRTGEPHLHVVLAESDADFVCYHTDDDLLLPAHVAEMGRLLEKADLAGAYQLMPPPQGIVGGPLVDLSMPFYRNALLRGRHLMGLGAGAHTMDAYRRLPHGWRTTPQGRPTDLFMWQQFLSQDWCRAVSGWRPTSMYFINWHRMGWTDEDRLRELAEWWDRISHPAGVRELEMASLQWACLHHARLEAQVGSRRSAPRPRSTSGRPTNLRRKLRRAGFAGLLRKASSRLARR